MTENEDALLPCPFCGSAFVECAKHPLASQWFVECQNCFATVKAPENFIRVKWNTRNPKPLTTAIRQGEEDESERTRRRGGEGE